MKKIIPLALITSLLLAACGPAPLNPIEQVTSTPSLIPTPISSTSPQPSVSPDTTQAKTQDFVVVGNNYSFDLKELKVNKGDTVRITFKNKEGIHDWRIDEFNAYTKQIGAGQEEIVSFVANKMGTFEYYCSVGQHRAMGMVGKLIVQ